MTACLILAGISLLITIVLWIILHNSSDCYQTHPNGKVKTDSRGSPELTEKGETICTCCVISLIATVVFAILWAGLLGLIAAVIIGGMMAVMASQ